MFILGETKHYWKVTAFILMCVCLTNSSKCYTNTKWAFLPCSSQATPSRRFLNRNPPSHQWGIKKPDTTIWPMEIVQTYSKQTRKGERNISSSLPTALLQPVGSFQSAGFYPFLADFGDHLSSSNTFLGRISSLIPRYFHSQLMAEIWMDFLWFLRISCFHWDWT